MTSTFYQKPGLNVESYDLSINNIVIEGDVPFYLDQAKKTGSPILELGSGTGRVACKLADAGFEVVGLDLSEAMRRAAQRKKESLSKEASSRVSFVRGDMKDFSLGLDFALMITPFRSFQSVVTPEGQRKALSCIRRHLKTDGRAVIQLFDPQLDFCWPGERDDFEARTVIHPDTGNKITSEVIRHENDTLNQLLTQTWRFTEIDQKGIVLREQEETIRLRWSYRWEMKYLFELAGLAVEAEYSDFKCSPPAYGKEQIWVLRKA